MLRQLQQPLTQWFHLPPVQNIFLTSLSEKCCFFITAQKYQAVWTCKSIPPAILYLTTLSSVFLYSTDTEKYVQSTLKGTWFYLYVG
jgi:hypothetical protein